MPSQYQTLRKFGIRETRWVNYRIALIGEIYIRIFINLAQEASTLIPNSCISFFVRSFRRLASLVI